MKEYSDLQRARNIFKPILPNVLNNAINNITPIIRNEVINTNLNIKKIFPNTYGKPNIHFKNGVNCSIIKKAIKVAVIFSGGQAPGGHNVVAGIFDGLKRANKNNVLIGYLGGASGILHNQYKSIEQKNLSNYRNTGGFNLIYSGRTKIETIEQLSLMKKNFASCNIDALIIIGGDDSNTNAAIIAEYFKKQNSTTCIIGVPKTIDGDLQNKYIEIPFGFDTATKIYSELVGNICIDVCSSRKYWHFIRLMGRSASHITLEVGLQTHPNIILIGEEILAKKMTLSNIVDNIINIIIKRSNLNKNFGIVLVPEGLIEFIPEIRELIANLNDIIDNHVKIIGQLQSIEEKEKFIYSKLSAESYNLIKSLPNNIASQFILDRDPHGNIQVSSIETEKLLITMIEQKLNELSSIGKYHGSFNAISHFFGYEGRCGMPSNFDANYAYALGYNASILVLNGITGYLSSVRHLTRDPALWECGGIPLTNMMTIEKRNGVDKPVIQKTLVNIHANPFLEFFNNKDKWILNEDYISPGPIQYFGSKNITNVITQTLKLKHKK
ncbi:MAG: diphosphate--fructose-6-phosphate 1-phosphotransferase [Endomicrobium sp.]|jgi:pyrophosphate--fructose-6-phosphate 1-phosphotransferase|nr:diphosphate--fructose-6-phosphate 1-phosphotransferase [Endomicrobium sp.]